MQRFFESESDSKTYAKARSEKSRKAYERLFSLLETNYALAGMLDSHTGISLRQRRDGFAIDMTNYVRCSHEPDKEIGVCTNLSHELSRFGFSADDIEAISIPAHKWNDHVAGLWKQQLLAQSVQRYSSYSTDRNRF